MESGAHAAQSADVLSAGNGKVSEMRDEAVEGMGSSICGTRWSICGARTRDRDGAVNRPRPRLDLGSQRCGPDGEADDMRVDIK